jgi:hypothetical protein
MPSIYIETLVIDETNMKKLEEHQVTVRELLEVVAGDSKAMRNHSPGGAPWILIGPTLRGRILTVPIDPTAEEGAWRPRTGYDSSRKEQRRYASE